MLSNFILIQTCKTSPILRQENWGKHWAANRAQAGLTGSFYSKFHVFVLSLSPKSLRNLVSTIFTSFCFQSPLDIKEIKPVNPKGNQPWILTGRTGAQTKASVFWPPDGKSRLMGKDIDALWERLKAEGEEGDRGSDGWMASPIQQTWTWANLGKDQEAWSAVVHGVAKSWTWLGNWTTKKYSLAYFLPTREGSPHLLTLWATHSLLQLGFSGPSKSSSKKQH